MLINLEDKVYSIGLMSGTSLDGIDVCLASHQNNHHELIQFRSYAYSDELRQKILTASKLDSSNVQLICSLNKELGIAYVDAINQFLKDTNTNIDDIAFIANHGQTIWHNPESINGTFPSTLQIGDASYISYKLNKTVVFDFRSLDISAGGCGAPLVPVIDYLLFKDKAPAILLNIGGISNITYMKKNASISDIYAFDTGPGNMLIDMACMKLFNKSFDIDGKIAETGTVSEELLEYLMSDEYFKLLPPKSTGREKYSEYFLDDVIKKAKNLSLSSEDVIATLTAFTAKSIINQVETFVCSFNSGELIVSGGGANNPYLVKLLKKYKSKSYDVKTGFELGYNSDAKEAVGFVVLGYLRIMNKPSNIVSVTGAKKEISLGSIVLPQEF